jgi:hypothetical protein
MKTQDLNHIKKYIFLLFIIFFILIINNTIYIFPQFKFSSNIQLASISNYNLKDGSISNNLNDDTKLVEIWLGDNIKKILNNNDSCKNNEANKEIKITIKKNISSVLNITITDKKQDDLLDCISVILNEINAFQIKSFDEKTNFIKKDNFNFVSAKSLTIFENNNVIKESKYKKIINIILLIALSLQIILIINKIYKI